MARFYYLVIMIVIIYYIAFGQIPKINKYPFLSNNNIENERLLGQFYGKLQGFEMQVWQGNMSVIGINYHGSEATPNGYGLEYPRGSGIEHLFGAAPWIGAIIDTGTQGIPKEIKAVTTGYEGWAGPLFEMYGNPDGSDSFFVTSINDLNSHSRKGYDDDGDGKIDEDELNGKDDDGDGQIDEDYGAVSESDMYVSYSDIYNDGSPIPGHVPLGIKVWQKSYAWQIYVKEPVLLIEYFFINIGSKILKRVYVGFLADCDVGPKSVSQFYTRNYSEYIPEVRTAFAHNPIDRPSTPIGITVLQTPKALYDTSMKYTFQWYPGSESPTPDYVRYDFMSSGIIKPSEYPSLSDTRFFFSFGPFDTLKPGDTLKISVALVSGNSVGEGVNNLYGNAKRAIQIYESDFLVPPIITTIDSGNGSDLLLKWTKGFSPYGSIISYSICYGTSPDSYTDSLMTTDTLCYITSLIQEQWYYFSVVAIDIIGNRSTRSNQVMFKPSIYPHWPTGVQVKGYRTYIQISWDPNTELDLAGYNVYRYSSSDTNEIKINDSLLIQPLYVDRDVIHDEIYYYRVTALDLDSNESDSFYPRSAKLDRPSAPSYVVSIPSKDYIKIMWLSVNDSLLQGYNIYRYDSSSIFVKLNNEVVTRTDYTDYNINKGPSYYYRICTVDSFNVESKPSNEVEGHTVPRDKGILIVNYNSISNRLSRENFYKSIVNNYKSRFVAYIPITDASSVYTLGDYSTVLWLMEYDGYPIFSGYPEGLSRYLSGGGNLLIATGSLLPFNMFLSVYGDDFYAGSCNNFIGAIGRDGFPDVYLDTVKITVPLTIITLPTHDTARVIYSFNSKIDDPNCEDVPVGIRGRGATKTMLMTFPLYYLDSIDARALITKVLTDFVEMPVGVADEENEIPKELNLYQAYPNPFNPRTTIKYDLPKESFVVLKVYNVLGQEVVTLVDGKKVAGRYEVTLNAEGFPSGIYFYRLIAGNFVETKKLLLMR